MRPGPSQDHRNEDKERVRDASDIVRVVGEHVSLKARGREYVGLCPFHDDHKPSMTVIPAKQIFHCFVCQTGGDVFSFIEKYHGMDFREALEHLAERAGITLSRRARPEPGEADGPEPISRADLAGANGSAAAYFRAILRHGEHGRTARQIIEQRGIAPEMVEAFGLGASANRWDGLLMTLRKQGVDLRAYEAAGLLKRRESDGSHFDGFRNRLMFPIHDQIGRIIAFGARKINEEDEPKYLNSPESALFEKSGTLYGLHQAARSIQTRRLALITEGYTDTIACHQAGFTNAVATLGTALTPRHASVLRRLCDTVVLLFDGDAAGQRAADRAVEVFFAEEIDVKIATLASVTDAKDPDELLKREDGRDLLQKAIDKAEDVLTFRYARIRRRLAGAGTAALTRAMEEELQRLVELGLHRLPVMRRMLIIKRIASISGLPEKAIADSLPEGRGRAAAQPLTAASPAAPARLSTRERALACIIFDPSLWQTLSDAHLEHLDPELFERVETQAIGHAVFELGASGGWSLADLCSRLEDGDVRAAAVDLFMRMRGLFEGDPSGAAVYLADCLRALLSEDPVSLDSPGDDPEAMSDPLLAAPVPSLDDIRRRRAALGDNRRVIPGARAG